jgi:hypothetical protein
MAMGGEISSGLICALSQKLTIALCEKVKSAIPATPLQKIVH